MKKNFFLTFCTACVPGAGQMYQGYMRRGASLMGLFVAFIGLDWLFNSQLFMLALPIIWCYAFFDAFRLRNRTPEQASQEPDDYLFHLTGLTGNGSIRTLLEKRHTLIGWGCILVAAVMLYNAVLLPMVWRYCPEWLWDILDSIPQLVLIVLLVLLGVYLLRGPKTAPALPSADDSFVPFKAPEATDEQQ